MLNVTAEEVKDTRKFFQPIVQIEEVKAAPPEKSEKPPRRKSSDKLATVDFFQFYQQTIKTRVKKKLEEEEEKKRKMAEVSGLGYFSLLHAQGTRTCRKPAFAWDALSPLCLCTLSSPLSTLSARGPSQTVFSATE